MDGSGQTRDVCEELEVEKKRFSLVKFTDRVTVSIAGPLGTPPDPITCNMMFPVVPSNQVPTLCRAWRWQ